MATENVAVAEKQSIPKEAKQEILNDYKLAVESRETSLLGRREVLTGKAKFGIFGDGKELAQIALAKQWKNGDWRSGYYRDQTMMMAAKLVNIQQFFAQLYAHPDAQMDPSSAGRQMNGHYASRFINEEGNWLNQMERKNSRIKEILSGNRRIDTGSYFERLIFSYDHRSIGRTDQTEFV